MMFSQLRLRSQARRIAMAMVDNPSRTTTCDFVPYPIPKNKVSISKPHHRRSYSNSHNSRSQAVRKTSDAMVNVGIFVGFLFAWLSLGPAWVGFVLGATLFFCLVVIIVTRSQNPNNLETSHDWWNLS